MLKTVVFDIGNVVWSYEALFLQMHQRFARLVDVSSEEYLSLYKKVYVGFESGTSYFLPWLQTLKPSLTQADLDSVMSAVFTLEKFEHYLDFDVLEIIVKLRKKGIKVLMLSNAENYVFPYIHQRLEKYFNHCLISWRLGSRKPDPAIYKSIFNHGVSDPRQVLFVDDKLENILAAQQIGIHTHLFTDSISLADTLNNFRLFDTHIFVKQ